MFFTVCCKVFNGIQHFLPGRWLQGLIDKAIAKVSCDFIRVAKRRILACFSNQLSQMQHRLAVFHKNRQFVIDQLINFTVFQVLKLIEVLLPRKQLSIIDNILRLQAIHKFLGTNLKSFQAHILTLESDSRTCNARCKYIEKQIIRLAKLRRNVGDDVCLDIIQRRDGITFVLAVAFKE